MSEQGVREVLSLLEDKAEIISDINDQIFYKLRNVLIAIQEFLEVEEDDVEWIDVSTIDDVILLVCDITYIPTEASVNLIKMFPHDQNSNTSITDRVQVGIPTDLMSSSSLDIKEFLTTVIDFTEDEEQSSLLTPEQHNSLLLFSTCPVGNKH